MQNENAIVQKWYNFQGDTSEIVMFFIQFPVISIELPLLMVALMRVKS